MRLASFPWLRALGERDVYLTAICLALVLFVSFFTHVRNYAEPDGLFWDENYHIPAAQKYLDGIFFMEYHPPLGKLLIALGEYLVNENTGLPLDDLRRESYIKRVPINFSYSGVRLFPALFGWFSVALFFLIVLNLSQHRFMALLFTTPYMLDNALIVHFRGAMLDGFLTFFILLSIYLWLRFYQDKDYLQFLHFVILGLAIGCAVSVKLTGCILLLLPLFLMIPCKHSSHFAALVNFIKQGLGVVLGLMIPVILVWYAHFAIGSKVFDNRLYQASPEYQEIIARSDTARLSSFPIMMRDTLRFFARENRGVPKLDVCKPGENGSYPTSWMIGAKSINYRWTKHPDGTVSYLYLLFNPVVLLLSLSAVVGSFVLVGGRLCYGLRVDNARLFTVVAAMSAMYLSYMLVMFRLDRVMYLYHYFPPYLFMLIAGAALICLFFGERLKQGDWVIWTAVLLLGFDVVVAFDFFSPLSYYEPLSMPEFNARIWFDPWRLEPIN